jgi:hypothetical protein
VNGFRIAHMDELEKQLSGKFKEKAVVLEKTGDFWTVRSNSLRDCNAPGLWILYGKAEKDDSAAADALEVGQVADIANEICRDIGYIVRDYNYKIISEDKRPKQFKWSTQLYFTEDSRDLDKYKDISQKYNYLYFDVYVDQEKTSHIEERQKFEIELAVSSKALYWYGFGKEKTMALDLAKKMYPDLYI